MSPIPEGSLQAEEAKARIAKLRAEESKALAEAQKARLDQQTWRQPATWILLLGTLGGLGGTLSQCSRAKQATDQLQSTDQTLKTTKQELEGTKQELTVKKQEFDDVSIKLDSKSLELSRVEGSLRVTSSNLQQATEALSSAQKEYKTLSTTLDGLHNQVDTLVKEIDDKKTVLNEISASKEKTEREGRALQQTHERVRFGWNVRLTPGGWAIDLDVYGHDVQSCTLHMPAKPQYPERDHKMSCSFNGSDTHIDTNPSNVPPPRFSMGETMRFILTYADGSQETLTRDAPGLRDVTVTLVANIECWTRTRDGKVDGDPTAQDAKARHAAAMPKLRVRLSTDTSSQMQTIETKDLDLDGRSVKIESGLKNVSNAATVTVHCSQVLNGVESESKDWEIDGPNYRFSYAGLCESLFALPRVAECDSIPRFQGFEVRVGWSGVSESPTRSKDANTGK